MYFIFVLNRVRSQSHVTSIKERIVDCLTDDKKLKVQTFSLLTTNRDNFYKKKIVNIEHVLQNEKAIPTHNF